MSAKARCRLKALADGNIEERVLQCFPRVRELLRRQRMNLSGGLNAARIAERLYAIDRGEDANVMKALRG
jgi:ABC-type branched-subunit amino acid transport system ATPase component